MEAIIKKEFIDIDIDELQMDDEYRIADFEVLKAKQSADADNSCMTDEADSLDSQNAAKKRRCSAAAETDGEQQLLTLRRALRKKDREFEHKKNIALEVSKYPEIYDVLHPVFSDKPKQQKAWQQIAAAVGLSVEFCMSQWHMLKRSAKYYATNKKSSASTGQIYSQKWPFREYMAFYTPPSLRELEWNADGRKKISKTTERTPLAGMTTATSTSTAIKATTANSKPLMVEVVQPCLAPSEATDEEFVFRYETPPMEQTTATAPGNNEQLAESLSTLVKTFSAYLEHESTKKVQQPQCNHHNTKLKYHDMWSNFDRLVSKLDEDDVDDLNIEITNLIGAALKKKRGKR